VSRMTSMRKQSRKSAGSANKKLAPVAADARENAIRYAETTRDWAAPKVEAARDWAGPRVEPVAAKVKEDMLPKVAGAVTAALVASEPAREEAKTRGTAAIAALRGEIEAPKPKKHRMRKLLLLAGVIGAAVAGWKAWMGQQDTKPEPWATPLKATPSTTSNLDSAGSSFGSSPPVADDAGGASPDEAIADAADEEAVSAPTTSLGATGGLSGTAETSGGTPSTVEQVPPKAAKKAKSAGEAGRSSTRKST
jgi:Family of unknown function (DUF5324)